MIFIFFFLIQDFYDGEDEVDRRTRTTTTTGNLRRAKQTMEIIFLCLSSIELRHALVSELSLTRLDKL